MRRSIKKTTTRRMRMMRKMTKLKAKLFVSANPAGRGRKVTYVHISAYFVFILYLCAT